MNKAVLILRYEIGSVFRSKSFLFFAIGLPLLAALVYAAVALLGHSGADATAASDREEEFGDLSVEGYVDHAGLLDPMPSDVPPGVLQPFPDEASALQALQNGEIAAYYVIPAGYIETGELIYVNPNYRWPNSSEQAWMMKSALFSALVGDDTSRLERARQPMEVENRPLDPAQMDAPADTALTFYIPYGITMMIYVVVLIAASLLMTSVTDEKKNCTLEVLLSSLHPQELLAGKIVGLGIVGLLQAALWIGTGYALLRLSGRTFDLPAQFALPPTVLFWGIVFSLLGYAVYASLMACLGALAATARQASQIAFLVIWPLIVPLFFLPALIENTRGALATALGIFPLTAPVAMMARLAVGGIPSWQPPVAALLVAGAAAYAVKVASSLFRAQTLLSGRPFSIGQFVMALLGRAG
jgi:ABC-2 type transport system permease protein